MPIDFRVGTKVAKNLRTDSVPATSLAPFPYIGIVKNNLDPTRCGRIQVFIPELGGNPDDQSNWRTVSYASPFMGYTSTELSDRDNPDKLNAWNHVSHTYGMWMVPPDLGIEVIVIFVAGDPMRGYWIACVNSNLSRHMLPALGSSVFVDTKNASSNVTAAYGTGNAAPVTEFNENRDSNRIDPNFYTLEKPVHEPQFNILLKQGLETDTTRGAISSSSQRETPSQVFGISTPGRPVNDPAEDPTFVEKLKAGQLTEEYYRTKSRKGGHTFVMDDGAVLGQDQLIRLRTAQGHQILMHDTEKTLYIGHADGISWIEMDRNGSVSIYTKKGFNVRSEGVINLHSDLDININATENLNIKAGRKIYLESDAGDWLSNSLKFDTAAATEFRSQGGFNIDSGLKVSIATASDVVFSANSIRQNSGPTVSVKAVRKLQENLFNDAQLNTLSGRYVQQANLVSSIVTAAPGHEPYDRKEYVRSASANLVIRPTFTTNNSTNNKNSDPVKNSKGAGVKIITTEKDIRQQPMAIHGIGILSVEQVTAYLAQLGKGYSYDSVTEYGQLGKYRFDYRILQTLGLVKSHVKNNSQLRNPNSWLATKNNAQDYREFLTNQEYQEDMVYKYTLLNYNALVKSGSITGDLENDEVAGLLAVAHFNGSDLTGNWRRGSADVPDYNLVNKDLYQNSRYAVLTFGQSVTQIHAG